MQRQEGGEISARKNVPPPSHTRGQDAITPTQSPLGLDGEAPIDSLIHRPQTLDLKFLNATIYGPSCYPYLRERAFTAVPQITVETAKTKHRIYICYIENHNNSKKQQKYQKKTEQKRTKEKRGKKPFHTKS